MITAQPTTEPGSGPERHRRPLRLLTATALIAALVTAATLVGVLATDGSGHGDVAGAAPISPTAAANRFFRTYLRPDGRVDRVDQGGDTVSEGQAYAMLLAADLGRRQTFAAVWGWTERNLAQPDGLLAWRWDRGHVVSTEPAADADIGAAAALAIAGRRFDQPGWTADGRRLAAAAAAREVGTSAQGPTLLAGPWAAGWTEYVNPSYLSPAELGTLAGTYGGVWKAVAATARVQLESLTTGGTLPPDWAVIGSDGRIHPAAPDGRPGAAVLFGFDAARTPIWMAASCDPGLRASAAGLVPALARGRGEVELDLGGRPSPGVRHPVGIAALAAATDAAGQPARAQALLEQAAAANQAKPSYYGTAWVALTALALDHQLERCS